MALQRKHKCVYHVKSMLSLHPEYADHPSWCPWCNGKLEVLHNVTFENYKGKYKKVNWKKIDNYDEDIEVSFNCQCGDRIFSMGEEDIACSCGRIYRFRSIFRVNEDYLGKPELLIELDKQKEIERYRGYGWTEEDIKEMTI